MAGLSYYTSYGFLGGPAHGRKLRKALQHSGYTAVAKITDADIVIAHSGSCWMLPENLSAKVIILVGMALPQTDYKKPIKRLAGRCGKSHVVMAIYANVLHGLFIVLAMQLFSLGVITGSAGLLQKPIKNYLN